MGGDGGTLAVKRAYLQRSEDSQGTAEAESHRDAELRRERYTHCAASGEVLKAPVVCCPLGLLYNKEAILLKLLQGLPPELEHVRRKELIPCELTNNPKYVEEGAGTAAVSVTDSTSDQLLATAPFICPVTGLEMNGTSLFCVLIPSGRVLSEKAINQVPELLHESESLVYLNPDETRRKKVLEELKRKRKQAKKEKKNDHSSKLASGPSLSSSSSSSFPSVGEGVEDLKSSQRKAAKGKRGRWESSSDEGRKASRQATRKKRT